MTTTAGTNPRSGGAAFPEPWTLRLRPRPRRPTRRPSAWLRAASRLETTGPRWWLSLQLAFSIALLVSARVEPIALALGLAALVMTHSIGGPPPAQLGRPGWLLVSGASAVLATAALVHAQGASVALALALASSASARLAWFPTPLTARTPPPRRGLVLHALRQLQRRAAAKGAHALLLIGCAMLASLR